MSLPSKQLSDFAQSWKQEPFSNCWENDPFVNFYNLNGLRDVFLTCDVD